MKCMLMTPRWGEYASLLPPSGRPYLDLQLQCLGFSELGVAELDPDAPFDPASVPEAHRLILVQGHDQSNPYASGRRLRRSLLSNLGLSLGLNSDDSDRLYVMGARPLYDAEGKPSGFAIKRRGRIVAYCEKDIWALRDPLESVIRAFLNEGIGEAHDPIRRGSQYHCWMVEGPVAKKDIEPFMTSAECNLCQIRTLPNGDAALLIPTAMSPDFHARLEAHLEDRLYAKRPEPLETLVNQSLQEHSVQVAVAESCTGGLITTRLSEAPGSSAYLVVGYVTYADFAKSHCLDINSVLIERCGAVSPETALAMARGALRNSGAGLAVSSTGVAGPDGGTADKPVGTVYLAAVSDTGTALEHHAVYRGNRDRIRYQTSQTALHMLRRLLSARRR